jgi:hypothetical protein
MKGKRLRQVQGHGDQQGEGSSTASRAIWCPAQLVGPQNNSVMLGLGALTSYSPSPARSFPQRIFYFIDWNTPPTSPCPPSVPNTRRALYSFQQRSLQRSQTVSDVPPSPPPTQGETSTQAASAPYHNHRHNIFCPLSPTALKENTLLQLPPSLLHHVPYFQDRHKFGKQIGTFFPSKLSSHRQFGELASENCGDLAGR